MHAISTIKYKMYVHMITKYMILESIYLCRMRVKLVLLITKPHYKNNLVVEGFLVKFNY